MNKIEMQKRNFRELSDKMSDEDRIIFYEAIINEDDETHFRIAKKYGYTFVPNIEEQMSDEDADKMSSVLLKNGFDVFNKINEIFNDSAKSFWSSKERMSEIPLSNFEMVLKEAQRLEVAFYENEKINDLLVTLYGEKLVSILKAAFIADAIGCLSIRNDLLCRFNEGVVDLFNSKAVNLYNKKKVISEDRSKAGKGNTSPYKEIALKIASDTWLKYPDASQAGMIDELFAYFRRDRNDNPSSGAIRGWLSQSGLRPSGKGKNRQFKLVINE